jgi:tetratricopeptide (TPR) repeat protein
MIIGAVALSVPAQVRVASAAKPDQLEAGKPAALSASDAELPPEQLGDLLMTRKRYQGAIAAYRRAPELTAALWNKLGIANQQMFLNEEARKDYEASLKLNPANPDVLNNLGTIYYSLKQYGSAERLYRKALKRNPQDAVIYKNLGTAYLAEHKMNKGWECFQQALTLDPEIFDHVGHYRVGDPATSQQMGAMNYYMAKSYLLTGQLEKAIDYLRMAMDEGFTDGKKILGDKQFAVLRDSPAFQMLLVEQRSQRSQVRD